MARRGPEGKIQDAVVKYAFEEYDCLAKKMETGFYGRGESKWFDMLFFPPRRKREREVFMIEFKAPGEAVDALQAHRIEELEKRGYKVHVISSTEAGKKIIDAECA